MDSIPKENVGVTDNLCNVYLNGWCDNDIDVNETNM
jgi:hypothetical protein